MAPSSPFVNLFQDDTQGWESADLYVVHGEKVTNRPVPNLAIY